MFDTRRAMIKQEWADGRLPLDQASSGCRGILTQVDANHAALPAYLDRVCDFGSFYDEQYELSRAAEVGLISQTVWEQRCNAVISKSNDPRACIYDPLGDRIAAWKEAMASKYISKEAVQMDCQLLFENRPSIAGVSTQDVCRF